MTWPSLSFVFAALILGTSAIGVVQFSTTRSKAVCIIFAVLSLFAIASTTSTWQPPDAGVLHSAHSPAHSGTTPLLTFKTVFDVEHRGYRNWWFSTIGLIFVVGGALAVFAPAFMEQLMPNGVQGRARTVMGWCCLIFASLWTLVGLSSTYNEYRTSVAALHDGRYAIVQGPVTNFKPLPWYSHGQESFAVDGKRFAYADGLITSGFHNTTAQGGPIHEGLYVRVSYVGNTILRLEIAQ